MKKLLAIALISIGVLSLIYSVFVHNSYKKLSTESAAVNAGPQTPVSIEHSNSNEERMWITNLKDVTKGKVVGLTTFNDGSSGRVVVTYIDGSYNLEAAFLNLPALDPTYFYEGWVVKQGADMSVISTGEATLDNDTLTNIFYSPQNLTDHTFYVLTVEPRDNNPKPADHVLEGILVLQN